MAEGKPIRKSTKKDDADKPVARRGRPVGSKNKPKAAEGEVITAAATTALAKVEPVQTIVKAPEFTPAQVRAAHKLDDRITKTVERLNKDYIALGEMCQEMQDRGFHRALGFGQFNDYLQARAKEGKTQVQQAMRVFRELAAGDNPTVNREDLLEMPKDNAEGLAKLKKQGIRITATLIDEAKAMPVRKFAAEVLEPKLNRELERQGRVVSGRPEDALDTGFTEVLSKRFVTISGTLASRYDKAQKVADFLTKGQPGTLDERFIESLVATFLSEFEAVYEAAMAAESAAAFASEAEVRAEDESQEVPGDFLDPIPVDDAPVIEDTL